MRFASAFLLLAAACGEEVASQEAPPPPPVHVETLSLSEVVPTAEGVATLEAKRQATLRAEVPGRVVSLAAEVGQEVAAGEVLARLDVGRAAVALRAANAQVSQAEAQLQAAERQRALMERLVASGGAAQTRLDDAADNARLAQTTLDAARAQTQVTRRGLTEAVIRAPFDGVIAERFVEEGELASPGAPVALLVDRTTLKARVLLDPREALDVPVGARATLAAPARPGETFEAVVERVGQVVNPQSRRLPVELRVLDPEGRLRPGLAGRFFVETGPAREALLVPASAIFERYGQPHVFVVDDRVARRVAIEVGETHGDAIAVQGVEEGVAVVVGGLDRVVHERPVHIVEQAADGEAE